MGERPLPAGEVIERLKLERRQAHSDGQPRRHAGEIMTGRLEAHGVANYQFRAGASPSYYVTLSTIRGLETYWGVDLERALKESRSHPKVGSLVGLQRVGSQPVTVPTAATGERTFRRTRWRIEGVEFLADAIERARRERESQLADQKAIREHPELRSAFVSLHIARQFAEQHIRDPRDRALFLERVKTVMALSATPGKAPSEEMTR